MRARIGLKFGTLKGRVRNPKNQLLQIDPPTIVGCSLWYLIARSTMKPETRLLFFTEILILVFREMHKLFLKFRAPHKEQDRTCCLARYYLELM